MTCAYLNGIGLKVTVAGRKGFDITAWLEAMEDATRQVRVKLEFVEDQALEQRVPAA
jgi:hypothetical protein